MLRLLTLLCIVCAALGLQLHAPALDRAIAAPVVAARAGLVEMVRADSPGSNAPCARVTAALAARAGPRGQAHAQGQAQGEVGTARPYAAAIAPPAHV